MIKRIELVLPPEEAASGAKQLQQASRLLGIPQKRLQGIRIIRRSIDARGKKVRIRLSADVAVDEPLPPAETPAFNFNKSIGDAKEVVITGFGPAGMFAALQLIELGIRPVVIERGKDVRARRRDLAAINRKGIVDPDSNYCFGEGGAGTYSDGKLYTRSSKRGDVKRILDILILHGADPDIAVNAHPHIGTNKLPGLVTTIRETIERAGGRVLFNTKLTDIITKDDRIVAIDTTGITSNKTSEMRCDALILATGHSARDIYQLLNRKKILIDAKPFALGVRVEHPQEIINRAQYDSDAASGFLPPAAYALKYQHGDKGVYSFCMCPGGIIAPAATAPGEIVVNGWSPSKRNNPYANSGIVVSVDDRDFLSYSHDGALAGLRFQQEIEQRAWQFGGGSLRAPAQRLQDFVNGKVSATLPECSYLPGVTSVPVDEVLPPRITKALREAFIFFGKQIKNYMSNEAIILATESRTSSPVRIPRDAESLQHPQVKGLFPCGEGAGYAGGIVSAAMDGELCAKAAGVYVEEIS